MNGQSGPVYNRFVCPHCEVDLNPGNGPIIKMRGRLDSPRFTVHTEVFLPSGLGVYGRLTATAVELQALPGIGPGVHCIPPSLSRIDLRGFA